MIIRRRKKKKKNWSVVNNIEKILYKSKTYQLKIFFSVSFHKYLMCKIVHIKDQMFKVLSMT